MTQQKPTKLPLLRSESPTEFLAVRTRMYFEIQPQDAIEEFYVDDIVALVWDIKRLRGLRISTIQLAYGPALRKLLGHLLATSRSGLRQVPPSKMLTNWLRAGLKMTRLRKRRLRTFSVALVSTNRRSRLKR